MAPEDAGYCLECDIVRLRQNHQQTLDAFKTLFELLEDYAPSWYGRVHHDLACAVLALKNHQKSV